jgi:hypothetical protein
LEFRIGCSDLVCHRIESGDDPALNIWISSTDDAGCEPSCIFCSSLPDGHRCYWDARWHLYRGQECIKTIQ